MSLAGFSTSATREVLAHHHQRHVADHLRRRRHLDDVAEHQVDVVIGLRHLVPARLQPERARLLLEVGELAARHLVQIDFRCRPLEVAFERRILVAHRLPVERDAADPFRLQPGIAIGAAQRLDQRTQAGLRGVAGERVHRRVDRVDAAVDRRQHRRRRQARRVVGVEMDRQVGRLAQRLEQHARRGRLQQPGHVLDGDDMGAGLLELPGQRHVVVEVVFGARRIEDVAGVADRRFAELVLGAHRVHRDAHVVDPVQAVEHPEQVDAAGRRLRDEMADHIVRIVGVADAVGAPEQHLQAAGWAPPRGSATAAPTDPR